MVAGAPAAGRLPRGVLLGRVRARREPPGLLGRARDPRGRPPEGGVGARCAARRHRPLLPARLLPAAARRERPAARALSRATTRAACRSASCRWRRSSSSRTTTAISCRVRIGVWRAQVGRVSLYLLDTKIEGNPDWARAVTDTLYGGDRENRLRQELVLGVGGVRVAAQARSRADGVPHERGPLRVPAARAPARARRGGRARSRRARSSACARSTVFTTHTPVPAGNEVFDPALVRSATSAPSSSAAVSRGTSSRSSGKVEPDDTVLRADAVRAADLGLRQRRRPAPRRRFARDVAQASGRSARSTRCRSRRSRTAYTGGRGSRDELEGLLGYTAPNFQRALRARRTL